MTDDTICTNGQDKLCIVVYAVVAVGLAFLLCGCGERGPTDEDMRGCASHRSPTWADLIECKDRAARQQP
jgi:hypothetical protein